MLSNVLAALNNDYDSILLLLLQWLLLVTGGTDSTCSVGLKSFYGHDCYKKKQNKFAKAFEAVQKKIKLLKKKIMSFFLSQQSFKVRW